MITKVGTAGELALMFLSAESVLERGLRSTMNSERTLRGKYRPLVTQTGT